MTPSGTSFLSPLFRTWIEIDRAALIHNVKLIQQRIGNASLMAVVKANAYGHGAEGVVQELAPYVDQFAVTFLGEALAIRRVLPQAALFLLSAALPAEYPLIAKYGFIPTLSSYQEAQLFSAVAPAGTPFHFKINTGMNRLGAPFREAEKIARAIATLPLRVESISSHLACADESTTITQKQLERFEALTPLLRELFPEAAFHILNSAGIIGHITHSYDRVRAGLMLYGVLPDIAEGMATKNNLPPVVPVMSWKARITLLHEVTEGEGISYGHRFIAPRRMRIAILPVGYADGYFRQLSGKGATVLIQGTHAPLLGNVTMDQIIVDVSHLSEVTIGEEAVLLGKQGPQEITASQLAKKAGTIPWHLFTGISHSRVNLVYR
jgi:alanine racemase